MKSIKFSLVIIIMSMIFISCNKIFSLMLGIKKANYEKYSEQITYLLKNKLDTNYLFYLNPNYFDSLSEYKYCLDTFNSFSPIQFRVYDNKGIFIGGWEQCFGNPKIIGIYDTIPPVTKRNRLPINYNLNFNTDRLFIKKIKQEIPDISKYDYIIIALWAEYLGVLSKKMLINLEKSIKKNKDKKILLLKVNIASKENIH